jgi:hypothetical protein
MASSAAIHALVGCIVSRPWRNSPTSREPAVAMQRRLTRIAVLF